MRKIRIVTDSSCDLNKDIAEKYNIEIVPLNVAFGDDMYADGEIEKAEFYKMMANSPVLPKTSCPSPERFMISYEGEEDEILVITLASKLSGTYSTAVLAKNMFEEEYPNKKVVVIDTETGSVGQALLIVKAAQLAKEGKSLDEIVKIIESIKKDVVFYGSLETLENAIKGGRVNPIAGKLIDALNFKVIVKIGNGEVKPCDKARGDNNSMKKVVENVCSSIKEGEVKLLAIAHANCLDKALKVKEMMLKKYNFENVMISDIGSVMGTYTSKGAVLISVL
nr:DegV family protein [uncultured Romboutsia sp.]